MLPFRGAESAIGRGLLFQTVVTLAGLAAGLGLALVARAYLRRWWRTAAVVLVGAAQAAWAWLVSLLTYAVAGLFEGEAGWGYLWLTSAVAAALLVAAWAAEDALARRGKAVAEGAAA